MRRASPSSTLCRSLAAAVAFVAAAAAAAPFTLDTGHTRVLFAVPHYDLSLVRGRFTKVAGTVEFDAERKAGRIDVRVDPGIVDTGNRALDQILRGNQYLDAATYGDVRYAGERFVFDGERLAGIDGTLVLHGVARPLRLTAQRFTCKEVAAGIVTRYVCGGEFRATLRRSDYGIVQMLPDVGDQVELTIDVEATRD
jgi:polyisoprenoid-binding protein YceI